MALGRSNSLSLNTSAVNSSFAQQQNQQPAAGGSLFGGSLFGQKPQPTQGGSLFGGTSTAQPQGSSLFGGQTATQPPQGNSLFGGTTTAQPQSGSLFGGQTSTQPAQGTSLFGGQTSTQPAQGTSLFGGQTSTQPAQGTSLFGAPAANQTNTTTSLFGQQQQQQQQQQPPASNSLFGGSLFGAQPTPAVNKPFGGSLFGASLPAQTNNTSMLGATQNAGQTNLQPPSLLGASRYALGQPAPFTGRLAMGQGSTAQVSTTPATKLEWNNVRSTTRFSDLVDDAKSGLEAVDQMIKQQETFCKQIEAFLPVHNNNLNSLQPDIHLIKDKCESVEQALISDAQGVQQVKNLAYKDAKDVLRCERICENLRLPAQYHYAPASSLYRSRTSTTSKTNDAVLDEEYDVSLVSNYFVPMASDMQKLFESYAANLSEIENHMQIIEATTSAQGQALIQQQSSSSQDQVRQLADTLRGFEATILATAAKVGTAREGVTDLSLNQAHSLRS